MLNLYKLFCAIILHIALSAGIALNFANGGFNFLYFMRGLFCTV